MFQLLLDKRHGKFIVLFIYTCIFHHKLGRGTNINKIKEEQEDIGKVWREMKWEHELKFIHEKNKLLLRPALNAIG